jgi:hypothetical protein
MWQAVTITASRILWFLGTLVIATRLFVASGGQTAVNGGAIAVPSFTTTGVESRTAYVPLTLPFLAYVRGGTGSTTIKYPAACFPNPLHAIGKGSGTVLRLAYYNGNNPTAVGGDIGLTKGCGDAYGSGSTILLNDVGTASGAQAFYTTGTQAIGDYDYIKFTPRSALAPGFTARIEGEVEDNPMR